MPGNPFSRHTPQGPTVDGLTTPGDVWVHFSSIEGDGYQELVAGEEVEFRYEAEPVATPRLARQQPLYTQVPIFFAGRATRSS
jgi:cold shock CspA family protein